MKRFGNHVAVDGISFEIPTGVVYGILGPNGAGKSTTLRMINDIIAPDAGEITILGGMKPGGEAARQIGYLPEERGLYPKMPVLEMIEFMGELRGLSSQRGEEARRRSGSSASGCRSGRRTRSPTSARACSRRCSSRPR